MNHELSPHEEKLNSLIQRLYPGKWRDDELLLMYDSVISLIAIYKISNERHLLGNRELIRDLLTEEIFLRMSRGTRKRKS